jgi:hypothetical protein
LQLLSLCGNGGQLNAESLDLLKQIMAVRPRRELAGRFQ